jgi:hypothetical protein
MLKYHMVVITRDNALKRAIKRLTTSTGSTADYIGDASGISPEKPVSLAIYDAREAPPDKLFFQKVPPDAKIIYIIGDAGLIQQVQLFKDERVVSLFCYDSQFDDDEFVATATKALRGEIFGLQKYFPWGVTAFSMVVKNHEEKIKAIEILMQYANLAGVRGGVRDRIQLVADELMMNALYHAPTDKDGKELYAGRNLKDLAQLELVNPIEVRYACSGKYFGISVRDGGGSLVRDKALEYMKKAQATAAIESKSTGAGLGLVSVLKSCSKLVFNLEPKFSTEVVALFDMELFGKGKVGARSLHLFVAPPLPPEQDDLAPEAEESRGEAANDGQPAAPAAEAASGGRGKLLFVAALLGAIASGLGVAVVMSRGNQAEAAATQEARFTVSVDPPGATIQADGEAIVPGKDYPFGQKKSLVVSKQGYRPTTIPLVGQGGRDREFHIALTPE